MVRSAASNARSTPGTLAFSAFNDNGIAAHTIPLPLALPFADRARKPPGMPGAEVNVLCETGTVVKLWLLKLKEILHSQKNLKAIVSKQKK